MDANAPANQPGKPSPPREADGFSLPGQANDLSLPSETDEVPRELDQTTLGPWLENFLQRPSPPSSSAPHPAPRDLADAVADAWPLAPRYPAPVTRGPLPGSSPQPSRSALDPLRRKIRRILRDRLSAADLTRIVVMIVLLLAGAALIVATALRYVTHISPEGTPRAPWQIPLLLAATALTWILGLTIPSLVMIKLIADLPWFRVGLYFSVIWFLAGLALFL